MCSPSKHHHYLPSEHAICKPRAKRLTLKGLCLALGNPARGGNSGCISSKLFIVERSTGHPNGSKSGLLLPMLILVARFSASCGQVASSQKNGLETHSSGNGGAATAPKTSLGRGRHGPLAPGLRIQR